MQYNLDFNEYGGLSRYVVIFVLTAIAGLFLYMILSVLTLIAVYFIKRNDLEDFIPQYGSNVIYLNAASKQWHKKHKRF